MSIRVMSAAVLIMAAYFAYQGTFAHANVASTDSFMNGVVTAVSHAIRGVADTFGRALAWG